MPDWIVPLAQVLFIDLVLAGDNAIVVGMAAAGLPAEQRRKAIFWGIIAATVMRIGFAAITAQLLAIVGITLAGGVLLLWVCWKMFRELRSHGAEPTAEGGEDAAVPAGQDPAAGDHPDPGRRYLHEPRQCPGGGGRRQGPYLGAGRRPRHLGGADGRGGDADRQPAHKHRWIAWIGLAVILYVAGDMIWEGTHQVADQVPGAYAYLLLPLGYLALPHVFPAWIWAAATAGQVVAIAALAVATVTLLQKSVRRND